jgi:hypothetical protein
MMNTGKRTCSMRETLLSCLAGILTLAVYLSVYVRYLNPTRFDGILLFIATTALFNFALSKLLPAKPKPDQQK